MAGAEPGCGRKFFLFVFEDMVFRRRLLLARRFRLILRVWRILSLSLLTKTKENSFQIGLYSAV